MIREYTVSLNITGLMLLFTHYKRIYCFINLLELFIPDLQNLCDARINTMQILGEVLFG